MSLFDASQKIPLRVSKWDNYWPIYDQIFSELPDEPSIVEIGVLGGGSLLLWREALEGRARVIGVDLNPAAQDLESYGVEIVIGDSFQPSTWRRVRDLAGSVDLLIDDGSHTFHSQIAAVVYGLQIVNPGGKIVIEDFHSSYSDSRQFGNNRFSFNRFMARLVDEIQLRAPASRSKPPSFLSELSERIESVSFYESIIVIRMSDAPKFKLATITDNGGDSRGSEDFRNIELSFFNRLAGRIPLLSRATKQGSFCQAAIYGELKRNQVEI